jgi:hypothetical protein
MSQGSAFKNALRVPVINPRAKPEMPLRLDAGMTFMKKRVS